MGGRRTQIAGVLVLCVLAVAAGWALRARCIPDGWGTSAIYAGWCYTDVYPLFFDRGLAAGEVPYRDGALEYPVLTGAQLWVTAGLARVLPGDPGTRFFDVTAATAALLMAGSVVLLARAGVPPRRLLWVVLAPTLAVAATLNWDPLAVALATGAVVAHLRDRDGLAGVAAGLGAAAKLYPVVLVGVIVLARLGQGRPRAAAGHVGAALAAWSLVNLPVAVRWPQRWGEFFVLSRERPPDWDSLWLVGQHLTGTSLAVGTVNALSAVVLLVGALAIAVAGTRWRFAGQPERWWVLVVPLLAWFLLTSKVYSPQFSLWLLLLLPLALPRIAPFAAFAAADLAVFTVRFPFLNGPAGFEEVVSYSWLTAVLLLRAAALVWIIVACVRPSDHDGPRWPLAASPTRRVAG